MMNKETREVGCTTDEDKTAGVDFAAKVLAGVMRGSPIQQVTITMDDYGGWEIVTQRRTPTP